MKKRMMGIYAELSAQERALLVLRDWQGGKPDDPAYRSGLSDYEGDEFNRLVELIDRVHRYVGQLALMLQEHVTSLGLRHGWLLTVELWEMESGSKSDRRRRMRDELRDVHVQALAGGIARRQSELAAADAVLAEVSKEFDGEDVTHPRVRQALEHVRDGLADLAAAVRVYKKIPKARADKALLADLRDAIRSDL